MAILGIFSRTLNTLLNIPVDLRLNEFHVAASTPTRIPIENGSVITDHIIREPDIVTIDVEVSNYDEGAPTLGIRAAAAWQNFKAQLRRRGLYQIITHHEIYDNMALTDLRGENTTPFAGRLVASLVFTEINVVQTSITRIEESNVASSVQKTATTEVQGGRVDAITSSDNPSRTNDSLLQQLFGSGQ